MVKKKLCKIRGEHYLNVSVSYEFKEKIRILSERYERTMADMIRAILKIGVPVMEGISEAEEKMVTEYIRLLRKFRKIKSLKEI